jgi:hypothetical protein
MQSLLTNPTGTKERKYQRLADRAKECLELYRRTLDIKYLMEEYCIAHLFECQGIDTYEQIASFCKERGIQRVVDIGCAYGHQSEVFLNEGIQYLGVDEDNGIFWNLDKFQYIVNRYPCELPIQKGDLGVSVLCLTWNCYLYEGEKTLKEQCEALQRDFEHCLLYMVPERVNFVHRYFKKVEEIGENLYYFSNQ